MSVPYLLGGALPTTYVLRIWFLCSQWVTAGFLEALPNVEALDRWAGAGSDIVSQVHYVPILRIFWVGRFMGEAAERRWRGDNVIEARVG